MPRDVTVTFEDGSTHVYRGAPDTITPEQVQARAQQDFGKSVTSLDGGRGAAPEAAGAAPYEGSRVRAAKQADGVLTKAVLNIIPGAVRGAGSIGSTLVELARTGDPALGGQAPGTLIDRYRGRTGQMDQALSGLGADPSDPGFKLGKTSTEVAGTLGVGGALANTAARVVPGAAAVPNLLQAMRTGGMSAGQAAPGAGNAIANLATRAAGGAITGGASAGLVDPSQAETGAVIGGALPIATKIAGAAGNAIGRVIRGPEQSPELAAAIAKAREAGYVIPPSQANPTIVNRAMEGAAGKLTTAQNASARNAAVTTRQVAEDLGLPAETKITPEVLKQVRDTAGQAYRAVGASGMITPGPGYAKALDDIVQPYLLTAEAFPGAKASPVIELVDSLRSPAFAAASAVEKIKQLRSAADDAFRTGNTDVGRAAKSAAAALEDAIDQHLQVIGQPQALQEFRDARQLIAKSYSVEKALNPTTGTVDARKLAAQLARGKPLSGGVRDAAEFAARFPKAAQTVEGMGSLPQTSPLDFAMGLGLSAATANPLAMAATAVRPAVRSLALSPAVQNRLVQTPAGLNPIQRLLANQQLQQLGYRAAPVALTDR